MLPDNNNGKVGYAYLTKRGEADRTYRFRTDSGEIVGLIEGAGVMQQAIFKRLCTPRGTFSIYGGDYGSLLWQLAGQDRIYVQAMTPILIREALLKDERIVSVQNFSFRNETDCLYCTFEVSTVYGCVHAAWSISE